MSIVHVSLQIRTKLTVVDYFGWPITVPTEQIAKRWIAFDADGDAYTYEKKPKRNAEQWTGECPSIVTDLLWFHEEIENLTNYIEDMWSHSCVKLSELPKWGDV